MKKKLALSILVLIGAIVFASCSSNKMSNQETVNIPKDQSVTEVQVGNKEDKDRIQDNNKKNISPQDKFKFDKEDLNVFSLVKKYYPDFDYSDSYTADNKDCKKMVFESKDGLYYGIFISYNVSYYPDEKMVNYSFDAGTANRGYGSYYVIDDNTVINIEQSFGTSSYIYQISKNGIMIDGNNTEIDKEKKYPIDIEYEKAMQDWSGNTAEGVEISCAYGEKWKSEMDKYYKLLHQKLDNDKKKWLVSSQKKWEAFTKDNEELAWQIYDQQYHGGSIMQTFSAQIYYDKYRDRALDLMKKYEQFEKDV